MAVPYPSADPSRIADQSSGFQGQMSSTVLSQELWMIGYSSNQMLHGKMHEMDNFRTGGSKHYYKLKTPT